MNPTLEAVAAAIRITTNSRFESSLDLLKARNREQELFISVLEAALTSARIQFDRSEFLKLAGIKDNQP